MKKIQETFSIKDSSGQFEVLLDVDYESKKWTIRKPGFGEQTSYIFAHTCNYKAGIIIPRLIERATSEAWKMLGNDPEDLPF